ncbi:hypothetical protein R3P38DRAFT_3291162 [Favolaschia claudopus]|uniref:Uncharacterized protein n=1 Tax=Favolaschia claudopus TaxID=2862362 RepID=A0AAV9ZPV9_9AGAR
MSVICDQCVGKRPLLSPPVEDTDTSMKGGRDRRRHDATAPSLHTLENGAVPDTTSDVVPAQRVCARFPGFQQPIYSPGDDPQGFVQTVWRMEGEREGLILKSTSPISRSVIRSLADFDFKDKDTGMKE